MRAERLASPQGYSLEGPLLLMPRVFGDGRGYFFESWNQQVFAKLLAATVRWYVDHLEWSERVCKRAGYSCERICAKATVTAAG